MGKTKMRTTRLGTGSHLRVQLKPKGLGWLRGILLAGRAFFGVCFQGNEQSLLAFLWDSIFPGLRSSLSFNGGSRPFRVLGWGLWDS